MVKSPSANSGDTGSIPGTGRSLGEGNGNLFKYFCLEKPIDREGLVDCSPQQQKNAKLKSLDFYLKALGNHCSF